MTGRTARGHKTAKKIRQAILRIKKGRPKIVAQTRKLSIAAVAEECGLSRAAIHKDYSELAEQIRADSGRDIRYQRDQKNNSLKNERLKCKELRSKLAACKADKQKLVSINSSLMKELEKLRLVVENKSVDSFKKPNIRD